MLRLLKFYLLQPKYIKFLIKNFVFLKLHILDKTGDLKFILEILKMNKITYHKEGDYLIPDLILENSNKDYRIGKYGRLRLRLNYIKEYKKGLYTELMINGTLSKHLSDIEESAIERIDTIINQLAKSENINEDLKSNDQLAWVQAMNNIKNRAEEIVYNKIIYM